jgi:hypothetical protein
MALRLVVNKLAVVTTQYMYKKILIRTQLRHHSTRYVLLNMKRGIYLLSLWGCRRKKERKIIKPSKLKKPRISVPLFRSCSKALHSSYGYVVLATW